MNLFEKRQATVAEWSRALCATTCLLGSTPDRGKGVFQTWSRGRFTPPSSRPQLGEVPVKDSGHPRSGCLVSPTGDLPGSNPVRMEGTLRNPFSFFFQLIFQFFSPHLCMRFNNFTMFWEKIIVKTSTISYPEPAIFAWKNRRLWDNHWICANLIGCWDVISQYNKQQWRPK